MTEEINGCSGCFRIGKALHNLTLSDTNIVWKIKHENDTSVSTICVPVEEILSVHHIQSARSKHGTSPVEGFTLCYVSHQKNELLRREFVQFLQDDGSQADTRQWCDRIQEAINTVKQRPHKLLVLVNPVSGGKNGKKVYETVVAGVFKEAKLETEVLVTERANHCEEILASHDLTAIDGIVLVGGDGLYHEAVNGLQRRMMRESGQDINDVTASLQPLPMPLGIIPAGTGNGIAVRCYGNSDPETAALAIVTGRTKQASMMTVHSGGELVGYSVLIVGYGFWADMIHSSDTRRHLGVFRYPVAMLEGTLVRSQRQMDLSVEYLPPLMSQSHDQHNQPVVSEQDGKDQSTPEAYQPIKTEHKQSEVMKECQEDVCREPMETVVTSGNGGTDLEPMKTVVTSSGDGNSEPINTAVLSSDAVSPDHTVEEKKEGGAMTNLQSNKEVTHNLKPVDVGQCSEWKICHGIYTGVCVTIGSLKVVSDTAVPLEECTRLLLNKPTGRISSLRFFVKLMSQNHTALEDPQVEHMLIKEYKVKLNNPSDPGSETGKKECMLSLDGEIFQLKQPEFHVRLNPKLVSLFASTREDWCGENVK